MALSYPYTTSLFADHIRAKSVTFLPSYSQEYSGQASGVLRAKDLAPSLWVATVETVTLKFDDANDVQALLEGLDGSIQTFYLYNPLRPYPKKGVINSTSVKIHTLSTDGVSMALDGLPSHAILSRGDMLSFSYGSRPSLALHRILETVTASSLGVSPSFQVSGGIRTGASTGTAVTLNKPHGEFRLSAPFTMNSDSQITASYSFNCVQVL